MQHTFMDKGDLNDAIPLTPEKLAPRPVTIENTGIVRISITRFNVKAHVNWRS